MPKTAAQKGAKQPTGPKKKQVPAKTLTAKKKVAKEKAKATTEQKKTEKTAAAAAKRQSRAAAAKEAALADKAAMELAHDNSWAHNSSGTDAFYFLAGSLALASFFRQWIPLLSVVVVSAWSRLVLFPRLFVCLPLCLFAPLWCHSVRVFFWSVVWCVCAACCLSLVERANPCALGVRLFR